MTTQSISTSVSYLLSRHWRLLTRTVDLCALLLVTAALSAVLKALWPATLPYAPTRASALFAVGVGYYGLFNSRLAGGQTPGKRLLGCRVVDVQGQSISPGRSLLRSASVGLPLLLTDLSWSVSAGAVYVGSAPPLIGLYLHWVAATLYFFVIWFDSMERGVHRSLYDLVVGTYVVKGNAAAPFPAGSISRRRVAVAALSAVAFTGALQEWLWAPRASFVAVRQAAVLEQRLKDHADVDLRKVYLDPDAYSGETAFVEVALPPTSDSAPAQIAPKVAGAVLAVYPALEPRLDLEVRVGYREPLTRKLARTYERTHPAEVWRSKAALHLRRGD